MIALQLIPVQLKMLVQMVSIVVVISVLSNVLMVLPQKLLKRQNVFKKTLNGAGIKILELASRAKILLELKMKTSKLIVKLMPVSPVVTLQFCHKILFLL